MSILAWIVFGILTGFIASKIVDHRGQGVLLDMLLGIAGAFVGGFVFSLVGEYGVTGFNLWSICVAVVGAVLLLALRHAISRATA